MSLRRLTLPDAEISLDPQWLEPAAADRLLAELRDGIVWENHPVRLFGREMPSPRLNCWIGDPGASYRYSGVRFAPHPWPGALLPLRERLSRELGLDFNSVLANRYRDGRDAMGWHSDSEPELGPAPVIASLSLGAARRFVLKHRGESEQRLALDLPHGSLLVMTGSSQADFRHALPKTSRPLGLRINLTFRQVSDQA